MEVNSINLAIRFLLEIFALVAFGFWGWSRSQGSLRFVVAFLIPVSAAAIWGVFAVPDDPSRSGNAPVPVPGIVRLIIELAIFAAAVWSLFEIRQSMLAWSFGIVVLVHYSVSYNRVLWLIRQ